MRLRLCWSFAGIVVGCGGAVEGSAGDGGATDGPPFDGSFDRESSAGDVGEKDAASEGPAPDAEIQGVWSTVTVTVDAGFTNFDAVWASGTNDLRIGSPDGLLRFNGLAWSFDPTTACLSLWGGAPGDFWIGQPLQVVRRSGSASTVVPLGDNRQINSLWGFAPDDVWGSDTNAGYLCHWFGTQRMRYSNEFAGSLWGVHNDELWAATAGGGINKFDGSSWSVVIPGTSAGTGFTAIAGVARDDIWAVGRGVAQRYDGSAWQAVVPLSARLRGVFGVNRRSFWAVGEAGKILRFDGVTWVETTSPVTTNLNAIFGLPDGHMWAVGDGNTVLEFTPSAGSAD